MKRIRITQGRVHRRVRRRVRTDKFHRFHLSTWDLEQFVGHYKEYTLPEIREAMRCLVESNEVWDKLNEMRQLRIQSDKLQARLEKSIQRIRKKFGR